MGSEKTPEEHAVAILTWLRAMFDAGSTLADASDIARLAPPVAAHIREYGASLVDAQRERDVKTIEGLRAKCQPWQDFELLEEAERLIRAQS